MIGVRIKELRISQGITQTALAKELSVSTQAVSKWETGAGVPDMSNLVPIAEFFGVSVDYLVRDARPKLRGEKYLEVSSEIRIKRKRKQMLLYVRNRTVNQAVSATIHVHFISMTGERIDWREETFFDLPAGAVKTRVLLSSVEEDIARIDTEIAKLDFANGGQQ